MNFLDKVYCGDALRFLRGMPSGWIDAVISDPMYGMRIKYGWGRDPANGDPVKHWRYHEPIYHECRRVLKPGGVLAWAQSFNYEQHFPQWFGNHKYWIPVVVSHGLNFTPNGWIVQTREQRSVKRPDKMILHADREAYRALKANHPCPKTLEELLFMVAHLTHPGQIVLDHFCGLGSCLVAAKQLGRRWIGCDIWKPYCQIAMARLDGVEHFDPEDVA